jgi:phosphotransferase system HPr (HPr) family protein
VKSVELEIRGREGLHARPAAALVRIAAGFHSRVGLENLTVRGPAADARSLTSVLAAGVDRGHRVRFWAEGDDEEAALEAVVALVGAGEAAADAAFERQADRAGSNSNLGGQIGSTLRLTGLPAAPGIAVAPIWTPETGSPPPSGPPSPLPGSGEILRAGAREAPQAAQAAESRLRAAAGSAADELNRLADALRRMDRPGDAEILEAQALMAIDPALLDEAVRFTAQGHDPAEAIHASAEASARALEVLDDELLAARASDVRDVGARIARVLTGSSVSLPAVPSIAFASDLPPSVVAEAPAGLLAGIVLADGSPTAHVAILARSLGVPAVVAVVGLPRGPAPTASGPAEVGAAASPVPTPGSASPPLAAIDGETGEVLIDPDAADLARLSERRDEREARDRRAAALRDQPARTRDGRRVSLLANIRSPDDARRALAMGAEGVGLFRTEYLFLRRHSPPSEAEQVAAYRRAMEAFGPDRPVVIRLADIGGDKLIPYLGLANEPNPFLGVRAIRLAGVSRDLLLTQLRAVWRAAGLAGVTPHVMAAMVSTIGDARLLLELRDEARAEVLASHDPCPERMVTGLMIEVPSAALLAPELASLADFFSIGTNDLTQYVLAADRGNPLLARLQDALHPAVLRTIASVVSGADAAGIPVAACGELAGEPAGALVLVGLGVDELSAEPASLDGIRAALASATSAELAALAAASLAATEPETVRRLAGELLQR